MACRLNLCITCSSYLPLVQTHTALSRCSDSQSTAPPHTPRCRHSYPSDRQSQPCSSNAPFKLQYPWLCNVPTRGPVFIIDQAQPLDGHLDKCAAHASYH
ncbi:hypothetical protein XELAEV_18046881mg [Xenopus laevis]|uniref:Uncharacterized protein n=1 Tax=Xenopus laevis TaxID=8355 RepID=A0A974H104_XENLA|nr:hypothetical protein XELAEV_18046881mg [Xenopus laevis]